MPKIRVLFVCVHNSARSQMAEAFMNALAGNRYEAWSAGLEPGTLNPLAVEVMKEIGFDISGKQANSVFELFRRGELFAHVVTVCDQGAAQQCPIFPGITSRHHWSFEDPAAFEGTWEERLARTRLVRDLIRAEVERLIDRLDRN